MSNLGIARKSTRLKGRLKLRSARIARVNEALKLDMDEVIQVQIGDTPEKLTFISAKLAQDERETLNELLGNNNKVFVWSVNQMLGINPQGNISRVRHTCRRKISKAKPRRMEIERKQKVNEEIRRLLEVKFIRPIT